MDNLQLNDELLEYLLNEREKDPELRFGVRVQNNKNRLEQGYWFPGNGGYLWLSFYKKGDSKNKTKTIGLVYTIKDDGSINNWIEVVYKAESDHDTRRFYEVVKRIISEATNLSLEEKDIENTLTMFPLNNRTHLESLEFFLKNIKPKIDESIINFELEKDFFYTESEFLSNIARINVYRNKKNQITVPMQTLPQRKHSLNQILYGPPGTGKTFNTINKALAIIESKTENEINSEKREILKNRFEEYIKNGQIVFTTFHQSLSYEDFIEGIKPKIIEDAEENKQVVYEVEDGIFKNICNDANSRNSSLAIDNFDETWQKLIELVKTKIANNQLLKIGSWEYGLSSKDSLKYSSLNTPSQYTFTITKQNIQDVYQNKIARPSGAFQKDMQDIVKFMKRKLHLREFQISENLLDNKLKQNYVLIIDEINRGNVSQIFGELITLIEEDKRLEEDEKLEITLPYSKKKFGVPSNLYIIGTMNTADRSVEAIDTALRRRFNFSEMKPKSKLLSPSALYCQLLWKYQGVDWNDSEFVSEENKLFDFLQVSDELKSNRKSIWETMKKDNNRANFSYFNSFTYTGINLQTILETINNRIEVLLDRDHLIGHAYFINIKTEIQLLDVFKNKIIPLLQEYFYNDYQKIALVLGEGFVSCLEIKEHNQIFAKFSKSLDFPTIEQKFELIEEINLSTAIKSLLNLE